MISVMNFHGNEMAAQEQPSNYITNMMLPERVKATRQDPLGPDCIITNSETADQSILVTMQYYWYISREKGCVECVVKKNHLQDIATTCDPKCVITRKHRRFEAYCCMLCRSNFVTIVQALLHLKAVHRPDSRILIHDKDIFHNLDKAMEVPPVPLPWHIAKKTDENSTEEAGDTPKFVIPPVSFTTPAPKTAAPFVIPSRSSEPSILSATPLVISSADALVSSSIKNHFSLPIPIQRKSPSPNQVREKSVLKEPSVAKEANKDASNDIMISIIKAISSQFQKQIKHLAFNENCSEANATFVDGGNVITRIPDLSQTTTDGSSEFSPDSDANAPLAFFVDSCDSPNGNSSDGETQHITLRTNRPALARKLFASNVNNVSMTSNEKRKSPLQLLEPENETESANKPVHGGDANAGVVKPPTNRTIKSVRFMLGAPDSSDDERSDTPERHDQHIKKSDGKLKPFSNSPAGKDSTIETSQEAQMNNENSSFDGLKNVVEDLMSTASKGRILSASPTTSLPATSSFKPFVPTIPLVGSSPALSNMVVSSAKTKTSALTRVQSWSPSVGGTSFSVASMRRPYTARGFTYAEKIELMKQQNDYDAEFLSKHIRPNANNTKDGKQEESGSEGDTTVQASEKFPSKESEDKKQFSDRENSDSDDSMPSMISSVNAMQAAAYSNLLLSSGIFPSEYYGSGEWANAAMEALKTLQSAVHSQEDFDHRPAHAPSISSESASLLPGLMVKTESPDPNPLFASEDEGPYKARLHESHSDDNVTSDSAKDKLLKVKLPNSRKRCKSNNEDPIEEPKSPPKRRKYKKYLSEMDQASLHSDSDFFSIFKQAPKSEMLDQTSYDPTDAASTLHSSKRKLLPKPDKLLNQSAKVPLSPLLSDEEKSFILHHQSSQRSTKIDPAAPQSQEETSKDSSVNPILSRFASKSMGLKCPSDPALSSRATHAIYEADEDAHAPDPDDTAVLKSGDSLQFTKDVSRVEFNSKKIITTRLVSSKKSGTTNKNAKIMNMPEMFRNCIDTCVKIQCIQKVHVCKVCGFSVDVTKGERNSLDKAQIDKAIQAHVMEHSLKELYATGYEMPNW